jgi:hypothetical protein
MLSTRTRLLAIAGGILASLLLITATTSAAGPPTTLNVLLCGTTTGFSADRVSGNSSVDHPSGLTATGSEYSFDPANPTNCQGQSNNGGDFTWTVRQDNVNLATERGNEHASAESTKLLQTGQFDNQFDGLVYEYDFAPNNDPAACPGSRTLYYASGHAFDATCAVGSGPGNFNTQGGAQDNNHYNGKYGVLIYQDDSSLNTGCNSQANPGVYCFQAIIVGRLN